jgi:hypothetical protein
MTTLAADITASQGWLPVADPEGLASGFYTIDDENVRVRDELHRTSDDDASLSGRPDMTDGRFVERAVAGTTAASHSSGATMTRYYPDAVSSGSGVQQLSLLGPYTVNYDDPGIGADIVYVADIDPDVYVVNAWFLPTTQWNHVLAPASSSFYITIKHGPDDVVVANYDRVGSSQPTSEPTVTLGDANSSIYKQVVKTGPLARVGFQAFPDAGSVFFQGVADIYLLIATPVV